VPSSAQAAWKSSVVSIPAPAVITCQLNPFSYPGICAIRTVRAVQVGNTKDISLAAQWRGEATADLALPSLDGGGSVGETLGDCGGRGEAQESGEGEECELHFGGLVGWVGCESVKVL